MAKAKAKMGPALNMVLILGSVREGKMVDRVSKCVLRAVEKNTKMKRRVLDPACPDVSKELNTQPLHYMQNPEAAPDWMKTMNKTIKDASAFLILSPEYNGMMPPALLNLLNSFPPISFRHRPCGIITYSMGTTGGMRALNVARPYANELGMLVVPGFVPIPSVQETIDKEGNCKNEMVNTNLTNLVKNTEWYARAIHDYHLTGHTHSD